MAETLDFDGVVLDIGRFLAFVLLRLGFQPLSLFGISLQGDLRS